MNYIPKIIPNKTVEELEAELGEMQYNEYAYGRSIDRPRMWDILHTLKQIRCNETS